MQVTREDWVKAGLNKLAEAGIHEVRVEALAKALKISKGSFYHYFRDRKELLDSMLDYWEEYATKRIIQNVEQDSFSLEQLLNLSINNRDKKMEIGIYAWAKHDPVVASRLVDIEEQRIHFVTVLYEKRGLTFSEAADRARLTYLTYVGWMTRFESNTNFDIVKMFEILLKS
ncbi:TetR/AcrR family transcriptional regulator [Paenibacillus chitinolyticus]|uniref:TetR/AcrR family transcriptional regulator n=1 Tax=Paenibacillus chitinolyticus TaxID=79263 RepID=A0A410WYI6_9BACL|nr:TetR/AcrR family transcriptional regulator [Paenibacillus chitinolyticus]MCY9590489.1 TetR/AcrR family transcriptional regulator [Paenibacillus chitinolyticus]MCY9596516.1 TetR/AcrR family transcriptional regulator [Paenibacillus chitinolyticus]QAV19526.1 TetR/AcrR family transcriptional regulator [Paenibacillus chitinolyticus]